MWINYLKVAFRNLLRHKFHSFINLAGLTLGLTCAFFLFLYVQDELSFDTVHTKGNRIYRMIEKNKTLEGQQRLVAHTAGPVAPALKAEFPEIEQVIRVLGGGQVIVYHKNLMFNERNWLFASPNFFEVFDFEWIQGNPATALTSHDGVVITESQAHKYFNTSYALGKTIRTSRGHIKITGVIKNPPINTHIQFDMLSGYQAFFAGLPETIRPRLTQRFKSWRSRGMRTYLLLKPGSSAQDLQQKLPTFQAKHQGKNWQNRALSLQAFTDVHFGSRNITGGLDQHQQKGDLSVVYIFALIGVFMLLVACINYMNLATARSAHRTKEIGIRKVVGAYNSHLKIQFLLESVLVALIAFVISIGLIDLFLSEFNHVSHKNFQFNYTTTGPLLGYMFIITLVVGLLSGSYPALVFSRLRAALVLKGKGFSNRKGLMVRQSLVVIQFSLSILMIIATLVVSRQLDFMQNKPLGFDQSQLLSIDINDQGVYRNLANMKRDLLTHTHIEQVTVASSVPGDNRINRQLAFRPPKGQGSEPVNAYYLSVDEDGLKTLKLQLLKGKGFNGQRTQDSNLVYINETAAQLLGYQNPIGQYLISADTSSQYRPKIAGVVKDFHFQSLHESIKPLIIGHTQAIEGDIDLFLVKVKGPQMAKTLAYINQVHQKYDKNTPLEYHFVDQTLETFYKKDALTRRIFRLGAFITILIACLGLFGLVSFTLQQRTKEIGIRKVLGASVSSLFLLLSRSFFKQVLLALLITAPLGYLIMNQWLQDFAYRLPINIWVFVWAGLVAMIITLLTISYQTFQATRHNPVESLRNE